MSDAEQQSDAGQGASHPGRPSDEVLGVLARLQDALANPEVRTAFNANPARTVEGYELLPEAVQNALNVMGDHELEHLANALDALMKEGFYVDSGYGRVAFF